MKIKNFEKLIEIDPEAVFSKHGDHLHRPENGWIKTSSGFIGIGYHGNEGGYWSEDWEEGTKSGFIPTNGYG